MNSNRRYSQSSIRPAVWLTAVLSCCFFVAAALGQSEPTEQQVWESLGYRLWILIFAAVMALLTRAMLLRRLNKLMLSESKKTGEAPDAAAPAGEVAARQELDLVEVNMETERAEAGSNHARLLAQARKGINRVFLVNLAIGLAYAAAYLFIVEAEKGYLISTLSGKDTVSDSDIEFVRVHLMHIDAYWWLIRLFLLFGVIQFLANRYQFSSWGRGRFGFMVQGFWGRTLAILILVYTLYFAILLIAFSEPWLFAAVALHLALWYLLKRSGRKRSNSKLLILRVFLLGKTSDFTFKHLAKAWKHFGTYFTVADPSFYKVGWKRKFWHVFPVYIVILFVVYTLLTDTNKEIEGEIAGAFLILLILGSIIFIFNSRMRMKQKFMGTTEALEKRLEKRERRPTNVENTFVEEPVMCYDNTWKQAVDGLIDTADVILMDLRGFSEANKGCEYEVNVLFDSVPANRIVFMAYEDAVPLVKSVIREQWSRLAEDSPNLAAEKPWSTLYTVTRENRRDMQGILTALLESTGRDLGESGS